MKVLNNVISLSEAIIRPIKIEEYVADLIKKGSKIKYHNGCYWHEIKLGFYQPVDLLQRLNYSQAKIPSRFGWGFRAAVDERSAIMSNGSIPLNLLTDVYNYDEKYLSKAKKKDLRSCRNKVEIFPINNLSILKDQGYGIYCSQLNRIGYAKPMSLSNYHENLDSFSNHLFLVGAVEGKIIGYISGYAINNTAHLSNLFASTDALKTKIVTGLYFYFVQVCRQSKVINEVNSGLHFPESPSLCRFKERMGFPVKYIPAKVKINPLIKILIRIRNQYSYHRLTGELF